jgi:plasmid stabilization system protein ParE
VYASIDILGAAPRASRDDGEFLGRELRSKLVMSHRVFFTIDDGTQTVYVVDIVHTARQTRLDEYEDV